MKKLLIISIALLLLHTDVRSQGCIMVRNISGFGQYNPTENAFTTSDWQLNIIGRYFKAFRDFKGTEDQKTPEADRSIVKSFSTDISITRLLNNGWSVDFSLPV